MQLEMFVLMMLVFWFIASQIAIPFAKGTPLFPAFRAKRQHELEDELKLTQQEAVEEQLADELRAKREALDRHRRHGQTDTAKKGDGNAA